MPQDGSVSDILLYISPGQAMFAGTEHGAVIGQILFPKAVQNDPWLALPDLIRRRRKSEDLRRLGRLVGLLIRYSVF